MSRALRTELLKLRTTRTFYGFLIAIVGLTALFTILPLAFLEADQASDDEVESLLTNWNIVGLLILVLGVVGMAGEHRHSTITATLLVAPSRVQLVVAKALAYALAGLVLGLAASVLAGAIALPMLAALDVDAGPSGGRLAALLVGGLVYAALSGATGVGVGALIPNQVAAVVGVLVLLLVIDPLVLGLAPEVGRYTLNASGFALAGGAGGEDDRELLEAAPAGLVYGAWTALAILGGALVTRGREIA